MSDVRILLSAQNDAILRAQKAEAERDAAIARAEKAEVERDRLRKALEPFAALGGRLGPTDPEGFDILIYETAGEPTIKLTGNDCRAASAALNSLSPPPRPAEPGAMKETGE